MIYKYFIPFRRLSFYFRDSVAQKFKSWWSLFYLLLLLLLSLLLLLNALICWHQKNHCKSQRREDWLLCLLLSFIVLALLLWILIHYELFFFFRMMRGRGPTPFFCTWISSSFSTICWRDRHFPIEWSCTYIYIFCTIQWKHALT